MSVDGSSHYASLLYIDQNHNTLPEKKYNYSESLMKNGESVSYARPCNYVVSQTDRCGNLGSSKHIPGRHIGQRHPPVTNHYTMAWIEDQNR